MLSPEVREQLANHSLSELVLEDEALTPDEVEFIIEALQSESCNLTYLKLIGNGLTAEQSLSILQAIESNQKIGRLIIGKNQLDEACAHAVAYFVRGSRALVGLAVVRSPELSARGIGVITEALTDNEQVRVFLLNENELNLESLQALAALLRSNSKLELIGLDGNALSDEGLTLLIDAFEMREARLRNLILSNTNLGEIDPNSIARLLQVSTLEVLILNENSFDASGSQAIVEGMSVNGHLRNLSLRNCQLDDASVQGLAYALMVNPVLELLDLGGNVIQSGGAYAIGELVRFTTTLEILDLSSCYLGQGNVGVIIQALTNNTTITGVDLRWNAMSFGDGLGAPALSSNCTEDATTHIVALLRENTTLRRIYLNLHGQTGIRDDSAVQRIVDALADNYHLQLLHGLEHEDIPMLIQRNRAYRQFTAIVDDYIKGWDEEALRDFTEKFRMLHDAFLKDNQRTNEAQWLTFLLALYHFTQAHYFEILSGLSMFRFDIPKLQIASTKLYKKALELADFSFASTSQNSAKVRMLSAAPNLLFFVAANVGGDEGAGILRAKEVIGRFARAQVVQQREARQEDAAKSQSGPT